MLETRRLIAFITQEIMGPIQGVGSARISNIKKKGEGNRKCQRLLVVGVRQSGAHVDTI